MLSCHTPTNVLIWYSSEAVHSKWSLSHVELLALFRVQIITVGIHTLCQQFANENSFLITCVWPLINHQFISSSLTVIEPFSAVQALSYVSTPAHLLIVVGRDQRWDRKWNWPCSSLWGWPTSHGWPCRKDKMATVQREQEGCFIILACVYRLEMWKAVVIMCCRPACEQRCQVPLACNEYEGWRSSSRINSGIKLQCLRYH